MQLADQAFKVGIVGSGPTAIYTLKGLLEARLPFSIVMFERTDVAGTGSPYRKGTNEEELLANIASVELPVVTGTLEEWLKSRTAIALEDMGIEPFAIGDREFFPRVAIGAYFRDQLFELMQSAESQGSIVQVRTRHDVLDIRPEPEGGATVTGKADETEPFEETFDHVVIATGHDLHDEEVAADPNTTFFDSPYPSARLEGIPACKVGILGTSLSGIDAAVTVAMNHGEFEETEGGVSYRSADGAGDLAITMMSRNGVLPEADFYCPIPYEPLSTFTDSKVERHIGQGPDGLLDGVMDLFKRQLAEADPDYASRTGLRDLDGDTFPEAYFRPREDADPFEWAATNLKEVEEDNRERRTVPWKYAILRMHEPFEAVVRHLDETDRKRFDSGMKKVFIDNYAAIPPLSIARLRALHDEGLLEIQSLGDEYDSEETRTGHRIRTKKGVFEFDVLIDATGQRPAERDLPFPSLKPRWEQASKEASEDGDVSAASVPGIYMAALPYMLKTRPFVQGLPSCDEVGKKVARKIVDVIEAAEGEAEAS